MEKVGHLQVYCTSWWSIKTRPLTLTVTKESQTVLLLWEAGWKATLIPLGALSLLPFSSCYVSFGALPPQPPSPADKAEPFISVTSHKSNHQLRAHYRSPDPSITEGRRRQMNNEAISVFPHSAEEKKRDDWFSLCLAVMCIRRQSIKYSLLRVGTSCDKSGGELESGVKETDFSLISESRLALNKRQHLLHFNIVTEQSLTPICLDLTQILLH